jgi:hypothetical protein
MLTEKSITQQLRFHKLPFPEDLGRRWGTVVLEEITALFQKVGLQPRSPTWLQLSLNQRERA